MDVLSQVAQLLPGPGWINDIFTVRVHFSAELEAYSPVSVVLPPETPPSLVDSAEQPTVRNHVPLFKSGEIVTGFARIIAPVGRRVAHCGVRGRLVVSLYALEGLPTQDLYEEEVALAGPGEVSGAVNVPFRFLSVADALVQETYEGSLFSIRAQVEVTVLRPWYTFGVTAAAPFAIQRVVFKEDVEAAAAAALERLRPAEALGVAVAVGTQPARGGAAPGTAAGDAAAGVLLKIDNLPGGGSVQLCLEKDL